MGRGAGTVRYSWNDPPIPWFVIGFLLVGAAGSTGLVPNALKLALSAVSVFLMVIAMAAMGLNTDWQMLRRAGRKVFYAGVAGFAGLAVISLTLILAMGI
jgi:uncharacterized membrane protein YadS